MHLYQKLILETYFPSGHCIIRTYYVDNRKLQIVLIHLNLWLNSDVHCIWP